MHGFETIWNRIRISLINLYCARENYSYYVMLHAHMGGLHCGLPYIYIYVVADPDAEDEKQGLRRSGSLSLEDKKLASVRQAQRVMRSDRRRDWRSDMR